MPFGGLLFIISYGASLISLILSGKASSVVCCPASSSSSGVAVTSSSSKSGRTPFTLILMSSSVRHDLKFCVRKQEGKFNINKSCKSLQKTTEKNHHSRFSLSAA